MLDPEKEGDFKKEGDINPALNSSLEALVKSVLSDGQYAVIEFDMFDKGRGHAITCRIERLLDGTIGIVYANSGKDKEFTVGSISSTNYVNEGFFKDIAQTFGLYACPYFLGK